jgi:hypothetical protein
MLRITVNVTPVINTISTIHRGHNAFFAGGAGVGLGRGRIDPGGRIEGLAAWGTERSICVISSKPGCSAPQLGQRPPGDLNTTPQLLQVSGKCIWTLMFEVG